MRCNSVITGTNLADVYKRAELFKKLGVKTVNFILFNPIEQAKTADKANFIRYAEAAAILSRVSDDFSPAFEKLTFRYLPLCLMTGYETHVQNVPQVHYDHDEWNYYRRAYIREPFWKWSAALVWGFLLLPKKKQWLKWGIHHTRHAAILHAHSWLHKSMLAPCKKCRYGFICGGVWKEYARAFGSHYLRSIPGEQIIAPWHFMTDAQRGKEASLGCRRIS